MKKVLKVIGIVLGVVIMLAVLFFGISAITEYKPEEIEELEILSSEKKLDKKELTIVSWNTGYAGLDESTDFFMDGGEGVNPESEELVLENMAGIDSQMAELDADFYILQEVDKNSGRSYYNDQTAYYRQDYASRSFANNFKTMWIPYPLPMMGHVDSGLVSLSRYAFEKSQRINLPCPFTWPVSMFNLKRCLAANYVPIEGQDNYLVLVNLHLEAYDDGEGKIAQTKVLMDFIEGEYEKGNYVIAGGDFNQSFPGAEEVFPKIEGQEDWQPGMIDGDSLGEGWQFAFDGSEPSCRSLIAPYTDKENHRFYLIDGFILSPNVELDSVETHNLQFRYTDHNPVEIHVTLK